MTNPNKRRALVCAGLAVWSLFVPVPAQAQGVSFIARRDFDAGGGPLSVAVGDFNGDGVQDLAVVNNRSNNVSVLLGNGDGTFQAARNFGAGSGPHPVAIEVAHRYGTPDLAVANAFSDDVSVLINNTPQPARQKATR